MTTFYLLSFKDVLWSHNFLFYSHDPTTETPPRITSLLYFLGIHCPFKGQSNIQSQRADAVRGVTRSGVDVQRYFAKGLLGFHSSYKRQPHFFQPLLASFLFPKIASSFKTKLIPSPLTFFRQLNFFKNGLPRRSRV